MSYISLLKILLAGLMFLPASALCSETFSLQQDEEGKIVAAYAYNDDISVEELKAVAVSTLKALVLGNAPEGVDLEKGALEVLVNCPALEYLHLAKGKLRDEDLKVLSKLKALKTLIIEGSDLVYDPENKTHGLTDKSIETLVALQSLEELTIRGIGDFSDEFVRRISELPKLEALEISSDRFSDRALEAVSANPRLKRLDIYSPQFTDNGVQAVGRMHTLEELDINSPQLTKQSLHAIAALSRLKMLEFTIKEVDREAMAVIAGLKSMEILALRSAVISDDEFKPLKDHPSLQSLFLNRAKLTEKSAPVLRSMKKLSYGEFDEGSWLKKIDDRTHWRASSATPDPRSDAVPPGWRR